MDRARLMELLEAALDLPPAERSAFLAERCGKDAELRQEIERLLALEGDTGGFLDQPIVDSMRGDPPEEIEQIGAYRVVETLDEGGMGIVYLGLREGDFEKKVAIKVVRRELAGEAVVRRFHAERQILARLEHPAIARLLDGGSLADGRPYLVMEYVEGTPVDKYCENHSLGLRQRLELFQRICTAVAYAHRNLIVHRDLKPANILVTADGEPKLLDFGIAKLLDPADETFADLTAGLSQPMTPRYAGPEQFLSEAITTATDVWALGLLLYELLAGKLPLGSSDCPPEEVRRRICEGRPEPPSQLVERRSLRLRLAGDLDAIALEALRKTPSDRYASVEQMAADVQSYLEGRPVTARRGSWLYRAAKLVRRRPAAVLTAVLIAASSIVSTVLWRQAEAERSRAEAARQDAVTERAAAVRQQVRAERVQAFLEDLFSAAAPDAAGSGRMTVRQALDAGREQLAGGIEGEPAIEAALAGTLGDVYRDLGLWDESIELLARAVELWREIYPEADRWLPIALNDLASALYYTERYDEAEELLRESLELRRRQGVEPPQIARALNNLASAVKQQGKLAEAGELYAEALSIRRQAFGDDHSATAASLYSLGALRFEEGALAAAEPLLRRALAIYVDAHGEHHTRVASVLSTLGRLLHARGEHAAAEDALRRAVKTRRDLLGNTHPHVAHAEEALAAVLAEVALAAQKLERQ